MSRVTWTRFDPVDFWVGCLALALASIVFYALCAL
jgi:hypothetical protein